jgi:putative ABC transport system substrate-binding protein
MPVHSAAEIDRSLRDFNRPSGGSIVIMPDTFTSLQEIFGRVIGIAARDRIPAVYPYRYMAKAGGLMSYGTDNADLSSGQQLTSTAFSRVPNQPSCQSSYRPSLN